MNALTALSLLALVGLAASTGHAQEDPEPAPPEATSSCLIRGETIKSSLEKLLADPEQRQLAGLQRALEPLSDYCDGLHFEHNPPLRQAEYQVILRQMELEAAQRYGDPRIIDKRKARLTHALQVLQYALGAHGN
ncbi:MULTISPECIES: DUF1090 family protein [Pseudomonas]|jgi:hypothetical protein|uniref:DUF1090 family protein n=1 Tax=Pseudomonas TaxID=286 RepID=UPI00026E498B|nr:MULTISPECIES: DUF1090 family protein [Pseudomonas]AMS16983.1 hypothetical protein A3218_22755 [Pseudomonas chlororaphis]AZD17003.1 hypothetical protein C4K25_4083 [Pseudomonas chlororaphis]EJL06174.1 hypothetical protein Pchl3084_3991 [Pseudomonas chlororaphis subsp. aureofaciens 30-84]MCP1477736.1 hypothetical protein [Pseudomonas chlororaphis]MCP1595911.1 hypothetical protein [Pseudomonas chlororaphis]